MVHQCVKLLIYLEFDCRTIFGWECSLF